VQFTSEAFTRILASAGVAISMDGRGRALDNVFVERLWRTVKYKEVYLKDYAGVPASVEGLGAYFDFYNGARLHQADAAGGVPRSGQGGADRFMLAELTEKKRIKEPYKAVGGSGLPVGAPVPFCPIGGRLTTRKRLT
jgi:hypothetical protein